jgi:hypothetical protein
MSRDFVNPIGAGGRFLSFNRLGGTVNPDGHSPVSTASYVRSIRRLSWPRPRKKKPQLPGATLLLGGFLLGDRQEEKGGRLRSPGLVPLIPLGSIFRIQLLSCPQSPAIRRPTASIRLPSQMRRPPSPVPGDATMGTITLAFFGSFLGLV